VGKNANQSHTALRQMGDQPQQMNFKIYIASSSINST
jgi:hypothetical protein